MGDRSNAVYRQITLALFLCIFQRPQNHNW